MGRVNLAMFLNRAIKVHQICDSICKKCTFNNLWQEPVLTHWKKSWGYLERTEQIVMIY